MSVLKMFSLCFSTWVCFKYSEKYWIINLNECIVCFSVLCCNILVYFCTFDLAVKHDEIWIFNTGSTEKMWCLEIWGVVLRIVSQILNWNTAGFKYSCISTRNVFPSSWIYYRCLLGISKSAFILISKS